MIDPVPLSVLLRRRYCPACRRIRFHRPQPAGLILLVEELERGFDYESTVRRCRDVGITVSAFNAALRSYGGPACVARGRHQDHVDLTPWIPQTLCQDDVLKSIVMCTLPHPIHGCPACGARRSRSAHLRTHAAWARLVRAIDLAVAGLPQREAARLAGVPAYLVNQRTARDRSILALRKQLFATLPGKPPTRAEILRRAQALEPIRSEASDA